VLQVTVSGGEVQVLDVPVPALRPGCVLVRTHRSLISAGTEGASVGSGRRESLLLKAVRNPALVRKVLDRALSHGVRETATLVQTRIASDLPLGYSCAGEIVEVAGDVGALRPGDRVACCGAGYANHAAWNVVPRNLVARVPGVVSFDEAAFGTLAAIALQGVRRCEPSLGDRVAVLGLGLIGQLTAQILRAAGARVIGADVRPDRVDRAVDLGLEDGFVAARREFVAGVLERTEGVGADAVVVTAAGTDPGLLNQAFGACRKKGRVVLVGDVPIRIRRDLIYAKEIDFLISTSYGPGRYDPEYEEKGRDYPLPYVRWTEGRNLEEALRLMGTSQVRVGPLIDESLPVSQAPRAYAALVSERRPIGVVLEYPQEDERVTVVSRSRPVTKRGAITSEQIGVGVIGFGGYFRGMLLPLLKRHPGFELRAVCSRSGLGVRRAVEDDGFAFGTTDVAELLADPSVRLVYVATRHDLHYQLARAAVEAGKAVFVEKPMTLRVEEGRELTELVANEGALLSVGFNRRFSPHVVRMQELLEPIAAPRTMLYRVNAGALPPSHWLLDPDEGGGRLLGEGVHFFDLMASLARGEPTRVHSAPVGGHPRDEAVVSVEYADGSVGTLAYAGSGNPRLGKERLEVFAGGTSFVVDDFKSLEVFGGSRRATRTRGAEKGQAEQLENVFRALRGEADLGVTANDGLRATWCAVVASSSGLTQTGS